MGLLVLLLLACYRPKAPSPGLARETWLQSGQLLRDPGQVCGCLNFCPSDRHICWSLSLQLPQGLAAAQRPHRQGLSQRTPKRGPASHRTGSV